MKQSDIDVLRNELGLTDIEDPDVLKEAIRVRFEQMNAIERAEVQIRIGRKIEEFEALTPGAEFSPPTWTLLVSGVIFMALSAGASYLILDTHIWKILKIMCGLFAIFSFLAGWGGFARVIYRLANKRDF